MRQHIVDLEAKIRGLSEFDRKEKVTLEEKKDNIG